MFRQPSFRSKSCAVPLAILLVVLCSAVASAEDSDAAWWHGELTLGTGVGFARGDYDLPIDTDLLYVPVSATYLMDVFPLTDYPWDLLELQVTVPFLKIDGPEDFFSDAPPTGTRTDSGLGDVTIGATYIWLPLPEWPLPAIETSLLVKVPTASKSKNLGTGATDVQLTLDVARRFGPVTPFAAFGYRFVGDRKQLGLQNYFFTSLGASAKLHDRFTLGLSYEWAGASANSRSDSHELVPFVMIRLPRGFSLGPYATAGLGGYVPDWGAGLSIFYTLPLRGKTPSFTD